MADQFACVKCRKNVGKTMNDRYRSHTTPEGGPCELSSTDIPPHVLANGPVDPKAPKDVPVQGVDYEKCHLCTRKVELTRLGYFKPHDKTLRGGDRCPNGGVRFRPLKRVETVELPPSEVDESVRPTGAKPVNPVRRKETTSRAPISMSVGAASSRLELPPGGGDEAEKSSPMIEPNPKFGKPKDATTEIAGENPELSREPTDEEWKNFQESAPDVGSPASTEKNSPESPTTSTPSLEPETGATAETQPDPSSTTLDAALGPFSLGTPFSEIFLQPGSPFLQPPEYGGPVKPEPMSDLAKELATKIKETFYSYSNRKSADNRSAQTTLGPSEIGTPCDRRLAMALMGISAVNAGGDGWAAFVGTCTHVGMAEVYTFADAGTGRYAVELPVFLGIPSVPRGTTDLLDRRDGTVVDWKIMGKYSLDKFKKEGPTKTYRTQGHVYGLGAERAGEKVKNIAIVGLPRAGSSLDEMHVWVEKYDRKFAQAALDRVEEISKRVHGLAVGLGPTMEVAATFETGDDCKYCPFHLKGDKEMRRGCPGK